MDLSLNVMSESSGGLLMRFTTHHNHQAIAVEDVAEPLKPLNPPSSCAKLAPQAPSVNDDFGSDHDKASRGLLSSSHGPSYSARSHLEHVGRMRFKQTHVRMSNFRLTLRSLRRWQTLLSARH